MRDEMVQIIAKEVAAANVGLDIVVYPGKSLFKPKEQWSAMVKGALPFMLCMVLGIVILCIFPGIATWLPEYVMGVAL